MKKLFMLVLATCACMNVSYAQGPGPEEEKPEGFTFTTVIANPITPIKNQNRTSTCWAFSSIGFLESELLRLGKGEFDLSEMFVVHKTMEDRAANYIRYHGQSSFSPGGSFNDVIYCMENYGLVPQEVMPGIKYNDTLHVHNELDAVAEGYVKALTNGRTRKLTNVWQNGLSAIYDTYLGECPEEFTYNGKTYTPLTFVSDVLGLKAEDYVPLTSFTHHPFYEKMNIEVEDNWRNGLSYNLPIDELMEVMDYAVRNGFTFAWGSDVSEEGFSREGIAVVPDAEKSAELTGSDMAHWLGMNQADKRKEYTSRPLPEITVTQEMRQAGYDLWETTDDHGMLIYGIATDQNGKEYFMVKNSWGTKSKYEGTWYASKAFVAYKTMNILVHKDGVPAAILKKLGL